MTRNLYFGPRNWQAETERSLEYRRLGIDPENSNPDGSDYHLMNLVDDRFKNRVDDHGVYHPMSPMFGKSPVMLSETAGRRTARVTPRQLLWLTASALICGAIATAAWIMDACADQITISVSDQDTGGAIVPILSGTSINALNVLLPSGQAGGNIHALTFTDSAGSTWREFAIDDYFNDFSADTVNFYAKFAGIVGPSGSIVLPTIQQVSEFQPGWVISTEVGVNGVVLDVQTFTGLGTRFGGVNATVGSPFTITETLQFVNNNGAPAGDVGAAVLAQPDAHPVPGPIVGAGLPGLIAAALGLLGLARRRVRC